jgi:hypothetical protein
LSLIRVTCKVFSFEVNFSHPMKTQIPPIQALRALDAFARLGVFDQNQGAGRLLSVAKPPKAAEPGHARVHPMA